MYSPDMGQYYDVQYHTVLSQTQHWGSYFQHDLTWLSDKTSFMNKSWISLNWTLNHNIQMTNFSLIYPEIIPHQLLFLMTFVLGFLLILYRILKTEAVLLNSFLGHLTLCKPFFGLHIHWQCFMYIKKYLQSTKGFKYEFSTTELCRTCRKQFSLKGRLRNNNGRQS